MNPLEKQWFYKGFRTILRNRIGNEKADRIWSDAGRKYEGILLADPELKRHPGAMVLPAAALFFVLMENGEDAENLLNAYGDLMGKRFAGIVHRITIIPGIDKVLWANADRIMDKMSGETLGYKRLIVSEPPSMYGVDILSCPYHELAKALGAEKAVLCICHMDKAYMKGFHHIRYERTKAVSEGADCCDYRLRFDPQKR